MTIQTFVIALVSGSAALAFWILARYTSFGPKTLFWAIANVLLAMLLLRLVSIPLGAINGSSLPAVRFLDVFFVALPLFVYAFLTGGWMGRVALGMLRR